MKRIVLASTSIVVLIPILIFMVNKGTAKNSFSSNECENHTSLEEHLEKNIFEFVACIRNEDIEWQQNYFGLLPSDIQGFSLILRDSDANIEPQLLEALLDKNRFVAAHVLLSIRAQDEFSLETESWNGLQVDFESNNQVSYDGNNLEDLHMYWEEKLLH